LNKNAKKNNQDHTQHIPQNKHQNCGGRLTKHIPHKKHQNMPWTLTRQNQSSPWDRSVLIEGTICSS
jgi:hypothetical protein